MIRRTRERFPWLLEARRSPLSIAHRGASDYAFDNSTRAFELAALARADFWELDVRTTRDDVLVVHHDPGLGSICGEPLRIASVDRATIARLTGAAGRPVPTLDEIAALAARLGSGLYIDAKDARALERAPAVLAAHGVERAVIASFDTAALARLARDGCACPLSVLVPRRADPFERAERSGADIVHLCWAGVDEPLGSLVTPGLLDEARRGDLAVVLWHEERPSAVEAMRRLPVFGLCSNRPEMLGPYAGRRSGAPELICHGGFDRLAPENTPLAAEAALGAGADVVGLDVRESRDGALVVIRDASVDRTTDGSGDVADMTLAALRRLDAGGVRDPFFAGTTIPTLDEMLAAIAAREGGVYVEIGDASVAKVLERVERHGLLASCYFGARDPERLRELRALSSEAVVVSRRKAHRDLVATMTFAGADIVEFDASTDDLAEIDGCRRAGCRPMVSYEGDDDSRLREILAHRPALLKLADPLALAGLA